MSATGQWPPADGPVRLHALEGGALWRIELATPKANILDLQKIELLGSMFDRARDERTLKAVLIGAAGPHFSFGASVEEHLPGRYEAMIPAFGRLFLRMLDSAVVTLAAVRGQCLGGGLELVSFCQRIFAAPDAKLGQPEIALGVFAPLASILLPQRVGRGAAEELCLSGRSLDTDEALRCGLVDHVSEDPDEAALAYARRHLLPRSASSLRLAVRALRDGYARHFRAELERVERLYIDELMRTRDAHEGLAAFLEKRAPAWSDS
jgi:cyclohexa-1,5-dienecarbonyl-CoA hydratase